MFTVMQYRILHPQERMLVVESTRAVRNLVSVVEIVGLPASVAFSVALGLVLET